MFQESYKKAYDNIAPAPALIISTLRRMNERQMQRTRTKPVWRRPAVVAAAILLIICTATPVMAANIPEFYELLYMVSPATAQFFKPVRRASVNNGIRMEVVATYIHGDTAEIYITLQDLTGNRVDATSDLYDSYSIHRPFSATAHCERIGYDADTNTATFLIEITEWGKHDITSDKLTFSVGCFISDKHEFRDFPVNVDLSTVGIAHETKEINHFGGSGLSFQKYFMVGDNPSTGPAKVLVPSDTVLTVVDGINISGIGYIDGKLHIQTAETEALKYDNHGYFYLKDKSGNKISDEYTLAYVEFGEAGNEATRVDYNEYVFDIPQSEISGYELFGTFYNSGLYTKGGWQVTFPLEADWTADSDAA